MPKMVRKQIYIQERHDRLLRRIAERSGVSQAEVVRQAIEGQAAGDSGPGAPDPSAWEQAMAFMRSMARQEPGDRGPRRWSRDDLYEDRLSRHARDPD